MHKRLLTVEDLVAFCETQNFSRFSAKETGYQICVQWPARFNKTDSDDEFTLYANVLAFHTGSNRNGSNLTESAAKKAIKNMAYKPVLANFCEIDGVRDFTSHDFEINEDGEITYIEKQVGCFTSDAPQIESDAEHDGRMNVYARVAIPREYTDAADIIERKEGTKCSVELAVNELSYDTQKKELMLDDVEVMGLTLLGVNPESGEEIQEGMEGAHVQIEDFSVENNSLTLNSKIINDIADAVVERISKNADSSASSLKEGGNNQLRFNELLEQYGKTVEDIEFDYENMSDEELEAEFKKVFDDPASEPTDAEAAAVVDALIEALSETITLEDYEDVIAAGEAYDGLTDTQKALVTADDFDALTAAREVIANLVSTDEKPEKRQINELTYSVTIDGETKTFSLSLIDKLNALSTLVNNTYSDTDDAWYDVDAYDEDKYVIMHDWWRNKHYRQNYAVKKDVYSLKGDRVEVFAQYLTNDEISKLDNMKADYAVVTEKLGKYEAEPEKMDILNSDEYAQIVDTVDFEELKNVEKHFDMSVEEVRKAADDLLLAFAKNNKLQFNDNSDKKSVGMKKFGDKKSGKTGRYGSLFKK